MKKALLIFLLSGLGAFSQRSSMDSLLGVFKSPKDDSIKCIYLRSYIESESDNTVWPVYNKMLKEIAEKYIKTSTSRRKLYYLDVYSDAINNEGFYKQNEGKFEEALRDFHKALDIKFDINDREGAANTLMNIGYVYSLAADYEKAAQFYNKCLKIQEEVDKSGAAVTLMNLGNIFLQQRDTLKYLELANRALRYRIDMNEKKGIASCYRNLAVYEFARGHDSIAFDYAHKALKILESEKYKEGIAYSLDVLGAMYSKSGNKKKAFGLFNRALEINQEINNIRGLSDVYNHLGQLYEASDDRVKCKENYELALRYAKACKQPRQLRNAYLGLHTYYEKIGNQKAASEMKKMHTLYKDSMERKVILKLDIVDEKRALDEEEPRAPLVHAEEPGKINWSRGIFISVASLLLFLLSIIAWIKFRK